ncbi:hypothetical protein [Desulfovirgula thermocuniculi]|uniref:hypothetical protein n=1 Tax=Desulfovirgula thermocuniculi TaxID=348842 RepID=UPI001FE0FED1|nr:hypothetical protein [Desulfovirgula thermocuniculi]
MELSFQKGLFCLKGFNLFQDGVYGNPAGGQRLYQIIDFSLCVCQFSFQVPQFPSIIFLLQAVVVDDFFCQARYDLFVKDLHFQLG